MGKLKGNTLSDSLNALNHFIEFMILNVANLM